MKNNTSLGWISLYRSIRVNWIWQNEIYLKRWLIILFEVNHCSKKIALGYDFITLSKGQSANSLRTWSNLFDCGVRQTSKFFDLLERDNMITKKTIGNGKNSTTLISVINYEQYQEQQSQKPIRENKTPKKESNSKKKESNSKKEVEDNFLNWFNRKRAKETNKPSSIKNLSQTDKNNLHKLRESYNGEDFNVAFSGMIANEWVIENKAITPTHFLANDNFNRYFAAGGYEKIDLSKLSPEERLKRINNKSK